MLKAKKTTLIIFAVALIIRLVFFFLMMADYGRGSFYLDNGQGLNNNDSQHYVVIAKNLIEHKSYSRFPDPPFQPDSYRTPLLPAYFASFVYFLGFDYIWLAILILTIILSLVPVAAYLLAKLFISAGQAFWVGLLVAVEPLLAYRSNFAEPDILMVLLFLISLYFLILFWRNLKWKNLIWSAVALGFLTLAKPVGVYLLGLFLVFILARLFFDRHHKPLPLTKGVAKQRAGATPSVAKGRVDECDHGSIQRCPGTVGRGSGLWKKIIGSAVIYVVIFLAIIFPWLYRNHCVFGAWDLSSVTAHNLYSYYTESFKLPNENFTPAPEDRDPVRNLKYQKPIVAISLARIKSQPVKYAINHLLGTARSFFASDLPPFYYNGHSKLLPFPYNPINEVNITEGVLNGHFGTTLKFIFQPANLFFILRYLLLAVFYLLVLAAWVKSFRKDKKYFATFTLFLVLTFYFVFTPGPFVDPKYRLPAIPLLLIMFFYLFPNSLPLQSAKGRVREGSKKIVIAADIFEPEIGGPATYSKNLATELAKLGWQVKLICYREKKFKNLKSDYNFKFYPVYQTKSTALNYLKYFCKVFWKSLGVDVIYAMGPVSAGLPASWAARLLGKKFVVKVVGDYAWEQARNTGATNVGIDEFQKIPPLPEGGWLKAGGVGGGKIGQLKKIEREVCLRADIVITPSQYLKNIVTGWGVSAEKIQVIYNTVEFCDIFPNEGENIKNSVNLIVSIGRLVPWKGFELLIKSFAELIKDGHDLVLQIYGSGPEEDELQQLIKKLNLINKVSIFSLPHRELMSYLPDSMMFVLNTGYEGLSHTLLEAMASGVPIITTNVGGNPELIQDGVNGLLVEYNNKEKLKEAILKLYNDPILRQQFIENSKTVLKKFTFEEMINKTENLLYSLSLTKGEDRRGSI